MLGMLAAALAPTAIKLGANLLHGDQVTPYERKMRRMSDIFQEQASAPLNDNDYFQQGKQMLDQSDKDRRENIQQSSVITGATNESRLGAMENSNEAYGRALTRLFNNAEQYRQNMQSRYLNVIGRMDTIDRTQEADWQRKINSIVRPLSAASGVYLKSKLLDDTYGTDTNEDKAKEDDFWGLNQLGYKPKPIT